VLYKATPVSSQELSTPKTIIFGLVVLESVIQLNFDIFRA